MNLQLKKGWAFNDENQLLQTRYSLFPFQVFFSPIEKWLIDMFLEIKLCIHLFWRIYAVLVKLWSSAKETNVKTIQLQNRLVKMDHIYICSYIYISCLHLKKEYFYNVLRKKYFKKGQHTGYNKQSLKQ